MSGSNDKANGVMPLTLEQLQQLAPMSAGDYYFAKTHAPKSADGTIDNEDMAYYAMAHAAKRKGLMDSDDDVIAFLDRVDMSDLAEAAAAMTRGIKTAGPLAKIRTGNSRRSVTSGG